MQQLELDGQREVIVKERRKKSSEYREKKKLKDAEEAPRKIELLKNLLKTGDYIKCDNYRQYKEVVKVTDRTVICICGYFRKGEFIPNGAGSESSLLSVSEIRTKNKTIPTWIKVKDLLKQEFIIKSQENG